jgi:hypothetical protein
MTTTTLNDVPAAAPSSGSLVDRLDARPPLLLSNANYVRPSPAALDGLDDRLTQSVSGPEGELPAINSSEAVVHECLDEVADQYRNLASGIIGEAEFLDNVRAIARQTSPAIVPAIMASYDTLLGQYEASKASDEQEHTGETALEHERARAAVSVADIFVEGGIQNAQPEVYAEILRQLEMNNAQPAATASTRLNLSSRLGLALLNVGSRPTLQRGKERLLRHKTAAKVLGVIAVAGVAVGLKGDSGMALHVAAGAHHLGAAAHGHAGEALVPRPHLPHPGGTQEGLALSGQPAPDTAIQQVAVPHHITYASGSNGKEMLQFDTAKDGKTIIKLANIDPSQSIINGQPIDVSHAKGLHAIITVTDKGGRQQVYEVPFRNGQAEVPGDFNQLVAGHDVTVEVMQNGSHGAENVFSTAVSNGHQVSAHEAATLERTAQARRTAPRTYRQRPGKIRHRSGGEGSEGSHGSARNTPVPHARGGHTKGYVPRHAVPTRHETDSERVAHDVSNGVLIGAGAALADITGYNIANYLSATIGTEKGAKHRRPRGAGSNPNDISDIQPPASQPPEAGRPEPVEPAVEAAEQSPLEALPEIRNDVVQETIDAVRDVLRRISLNPKARVMKRPEADNADQYLVLLTSLTKKSLVDGRAVPTGDINRYTQAIVAQIMQQGGSAQELYDYLIAPPEPRT